jgi:nucleoside-diphosphate-sugar epimerase
VITLLGAGGVIGNELVKLLAADGQPVRLVGRQPVLLQGAQEAVTADLCDQAQTLNAVAGSSIVFLLAGLKYDHKVWAESWPRIMVNTVEACKRAGAKLVFFDNVYMYGRVHGAMTEETPFNPCSRKGEVRARIAGALASEWKAGGLTSMIARAADFYGPGAKNGVANVLVFEPFASRKKATWLVNDTLPHSFTYTPDAAQALVKLAQTASAWNQTWHLPTAPNAPTGKEFIARAAEGMHVPARYRVMGKGMIRVGGWFNPLVGEIYEMLYQNDSPYLFDSSKYGRAFGFHGTPYADGIRVTAGTYRKDG